MNVKVSTFMGKTWLRQREFQAIQLLETNHSYDHVATVMGRTVMGVRMMASRKWHAPLTKAGPTRTARGVARLMGVSDHVIGRWIRKGWLKASLFALPHAKVWRVEEDALNAFLENEDYWHLWEPERMTDEGFRAWCEEMRTGIRFINIIEVAGLLGYSRGSINRLIHSGHIKARKRGDREWMIRLSEVKSMLISGRE